MKYSVDSVISDGKFLVLKVKINNNSFANDSFDNDSFASDSFDNDSLVNDNKFYALKVFPHHTKGDVKFINKNYLNEKRFGYLSHNNIINGFNFCDNTVLKFGGKNIHCSCMLMKYGSNGTLFDFIKKFSK